MFVFAVLIMKYLEEQTSWKNLEKEVEDMPLDLNGVYVATCILSSLSALPHIL